MKLELKHLGPYLPYGLKVVSKRNRIQKMGVYSGIEYGVSVCDIGFVLNNDLKPILRPINELTVDDLKRMLGEYVTDFDYSNYKIFILKVNNIFDGQLEPLDYCQTQELFAEHWDLFQLIPQGLAISIHDVKC